MCGEAGDLPILLSTIFSILLTSLCDRWCFWAAQPRFPLPHIRVSITIRNPRCSLFVAGEKFSPHTNKGPLTPSLLPQNPKPPLLCPESLTMCFVSFFTFVLCVWWQSWPLNQILSKEAPWSNIIMKSVCCHASPSSQISSAFALFAPHQENPLLWNWRVAHGYGFSISLSGNLRVLFDEWVQKLESETEEHFCFKYEFHLTSTACIPKLKSPNGQFRASYV